MFDGGGTLTVKEYLLSIAVVSVLTVISQLLLPEGKLKKTSQVIFNFIIILCIINPIISNKLNLDLTFSAEEREMKIDDSAVYLIREQETLNLEKNCQALLNSEGIEGVKVKIQPSNLTEVFSIEKVTLNFDNLRISEESEHINIISKAITIVSDYLSFSKEDIVIE